MPNRYTAHHTSEEAKRDRPHLQEKARVLLRDGIVSTPRARKKPRGTSGRCAGGARRSVYLPHSSATARLRLSAREEAVVKVQAMVRGWQTRHYLHRQHLAATHIQRLMRGALVRTGSWHPKFDGDPLQLKKTGRKGFDKDMKAYAKAVDELGQKTSLNERKLGAILEEMVWETKQFSRDVATAWWRRSREMQQEALDRIRKEVSARLKEQKHLFRSVIDANMESLSPDLAASGLLTHLETSVARIRKKRSGDPMDDGTSEPAVPLANLLMKRGYKMKHLRSVVQAVRALRSTTTVCEMAQESDGDKDESFDAMATVRCTECYL